MQSYTTQVNTYHRLADRYGGLPRNRPLTERELCLALILYALTGHKPTTYAQFVSALNSWHKKQYGVPLPRNERYDDVRVGLLNRFGNLNVSIPKTAVTIDDLKAIHRQLDTRYFEHARDWCACLIAFFGLLRGTEHMSGGLRIGQVQMASAPSNGKPSGLHIVINSSKTSNAPVQISISTQPDPLCPVTAYLHYRRFLLKLKIPTTANSPLFVWRFSNGSHKAMSVDEFIKAVRAYYKAAFPDRDPLTYAGHSFRRGGTSALILAGVSVPMIKSHGRWSSEAFQRYFDSVHNDSMRLAATQALDDSSKRARLN